MAYHAIKAEHWPQHTKSKEPSTTAQLNINGTIHDARAKVRDWVGDYNKKGGRFLIYLDDQLAYDSQLLNKI